MEESKLYIQDGQSKGYIDIGYIFKQGYPFSMLVGGRGIGKTYGALKYLKQNGIKFIFMRNTTSQVETLSVPELSPWTSLNNDMGWSVTVKKISKYVSGFYETDEEGKPVGEAIGLVVALSTIANIRGFDAQDCKYFIWDEFIPEKHERKLKNMDTAYFNAVETINRNRELKGKPPLQCISLSNSNNLANPIFLALGIVKILVKLKKQERMIYENRERGLSIIMFEDSPISEQKKDSALYKLTAGSDFAKMALENEFAEDVIGRVKSMPLKEYTPLCKYGDLCIYEHKRRDELYCTMHKSGRMDEYNAISKADKMRFIRNYKWVFDYYMTEDIIFEEYLCEILLQDAFN